MAIKPQDIQETLAWLSEMGVSHLVGNTPTSWTVAPAPAPDLPDLASLRKAVESFEGCSLKRTAKNTVFGEGPLNPSIMLIGEAPGADEDQQGRPFVGMSGQLLTKVFAAIGFERSSIYITNILPWRPPGNRQPTNAEIIACLPFVRQHIRIVQPKVLVFVGGTSVKALLDRGDGITRLRGQWLTYKDQDFQCPSMAMFHPAFLLRSPSRKRDVWQDALKIKEKVG